MIEQSVNFSNTIVDPCGFNAALKNGIIPSGSVAGDVCKECTKTTSSDGSTSESCVLPSCPIAQNIQLVAIAEQIGADTTDIIDKSGVLNQLSQYVDQTKLTKNKGVGDAVSTAAGGIGDAVGGIFKGPDRSP